jgi:EAL domain-containing protein (putative c-di-GMP-specific phosphodiesterase class I)
MWIATALTERMLGLVAADIRGWLDLGLEVRHIGLNVSSADFHGGQLAEQVCRTFAAARVPLDRIILEVTETVYMGQTDHVVAQQIRHLRERGLRIALDDFGTGFASLTHLMTVPIDILKIDKTFVDQLVGDGVSRAIVEGLLHIARELNVEVIAEGVETEEQARLLLAAGCKLAQGYLFAAPVGAEQATDLLVRQAGLPAPVALARS